jgi:hypothetical protein
MSNKANILEKCLAYGVDPSRNTFRHETCFCWDLHRRLKNAKQQQELDFDVWIELAMLLLIQN